MVLPQINLRKLLRIASRAQRILTRRDCRGFHNIHSHELPVYLISPRIAYFPAICRITQNTAVLNTGNCNMYSYSFLRGAGLHTTQVCREAKSTRRCQQQHVLCFKTTETGLQNQQSGGSSQLPSEVTRYDSRQAPYLFYLQ